MKCTKKKLAEMLIECNRILDAHRCLTCKHWEQKTFYTYENAKNTGIISSNLLVSRSVAEFAYKMSKAMEDIASSNVFFMMQQAYTENVMYDYRLCQEKWKELQDELRQHFC